MRVDEMVRKRKSVTLTEVETFEHKSAKRKNIPPAKIAGEGTIPKVNKVQYSYSPHLSPVLRSDPDGSTDKIPEIVEKALIGKTLSASERELLRSIAANASQPWLEWAGKKAEHDRGVLEVDPVALHIHERVSAQAIVRAAMREDVQRKLFADPEQAYNEALQFYRHDINWANRLILGDSLQVMSSLARRENLAGKVQMVFIDPPYGIKFKSNFQSEIGRREVQEREKDLTREPEMVKAYRDTWKLGIHSYLSYLRDRLVLAKELLSNTGSIFVQISEENVHFVRNMLTEIFGNDNFVTQIWFRKKLMPLGGKLLEGMGDYLLWFAKNKPLIKYHRLYVPTVPDPKGRWTGVADENETLRRLDIDEKKIVANLPKHLDLFSTVSQWAPSFSKKNVYDFKFEGKSYTPNVGQCWVTTKENMDRLALANRLYVEGAFPRFVSFHKDFPFRKLTHPWADTAPAQNKKFVVVTNNNVIERCLLMTTDPGDLVLDPTCGSGTTAYVSEQWGRRWITIDTSRVAISIARQRLLTAHFNRYRLVDEKIDDHKENMFSGFDPSANFIYQTAPRVSLKSIAANQTLEHISDYHQEGLDEKLAKCNKALNDVSNVIRKQFAYKLADKMQQKGIKSVTDADRRRWLLPGTTKQILEQAYAGKSRIKDRHINNDIKFVPPDDIFEHWHVPFDVDNDWPRSLQVAVKEYRKAWHLRMDAVNACIEGNSDLEALVDQPQVIKNIVRVSGPFTVEGVRPEELSLGEDGGIFDPTPNDWGENDKSSNYSQNASAYLDRMLQLLRKDGVTFPNNEFRVFDRVESLYETDTALHAEGVWEGNDVEQPCDIAIAFGPQYGPVTAEMVEDLIRSSRRYDELVVAAFSFDGAAQEIIQEAQHPHLQIHMAHIRPDVSPGMDGLLKDTPNNQLFTVFGQPDIEVRKAKDGDNDELEVELLGVDIYSPLTGEVHSTGASKVAAWFLDSDYDSRCFCITQAFFPNQKAWDKIAKALGSAADTELFKSYRGTVSIPFKLGKHERIAVKVIDPRGNEVIAIHSLKEVK